MARTSEQILREASKNSRSSSQILGEAGVQNKNYNEQLLAQKRTQYYTDLTANDTQLQKMLKDYNTSSQEYSAGAQNRYADGYGKSYVGDSAGYLDSVTAGRDSLTQMQGDISNYVRKNYGDRAYNDWLKGQFTTDSRNYDKIFNIATDDNTYWSQFKDEDDYSAWLTAEQQRKEFGVHTQEDLEQYDRDWNEYNNLRHQNRFGGGSERYNELDEYFKSINVTNNRESEQYRRQIEDSITPADYSGIRKNADYAEKSGAPDVATSHDWAITARNKGYNANILDDEQRADLNYLLNTQGLEAAADYFNYVQPIAQQAMAEKLYKDIEDLWDTSDSGAFVQKLDNVLETTVETALGMAGGAAGALTRAGGNSNNLTNTWEIMNSVAQQNANSNIERYLLAAGQTIGNMIPSMVVGTLVTSLTGGMGFAPEIARRVGNFFGSSIMGIGAARQAKTEATSKGNSAEAATTYGTLIGAAEVALGMLFNKVPGMGGYLSGEVLEGAVQRISNSLLRTVAGLAAANVGEIIEEVSQNHLQAALEWALLGEQYSLQDILWMPEEDLDTIWITLLSTTGTNVGARVSNNFNYVEGSADMVGLANEYGIDTSKLEGTMANRKNGLLNANEAENLQYQINEAERQAREGAVRESLGDVENADKLARIMSRLEYNDDGSVNTENLFGRERKTYEQASKADATKEAVSRASETAKNFTSDNVKNFYRSKVTDYTTKENGEEVKHRVSSVIASDDGSIRARVKTGESIETKSLDELPAEVKQQIDYAKNALGDTKAAVIAYNNYDGKIAYNDYIGMAATVVTSAKETTKGADSEYFKKAAMRIGEQATRELYDYGASLRKTTEQLIGNQKIGKEWHKPGVTAISSDETVNGTTFKAINEGKLKSELSNREYNIYKKTKKVLEALAKVLNLDLRMFDSRNADGTISSNVPSGMYAEGTRTIYLDIFAYVSGKADMTQAMVINVLAHEMTHFMQNNDIETYNRLKEFIFDKLQENPEYFASIVVTRNQSNAAKLNEDTIGYAADEIVARACENMLNDSNIIRDLYMADASLAEKIKLRLDEMLDSIRKLIKYSPSTEAVYMKNYANDLQKIWDEGMKKAIKAEADAEKMADLTDAQQGKNVQFAEREQSENGQAIKKVLAGTAFSGGGTVDFALSAILDSQFAVEYDAKISAVYQQNNKTMFMGKDILDFEPEKFKGKVEYFHASPVCKTFSSAITAEGKKTRVDTGIDKMTAEATAKAIRAIEPKVFTLENVIGYKNTKELKVITDVLDELGYTWDIGTYNSADFGAATSRERVFVRAVKDGTLPYNDNYKVGNKAYDRKKGDRIGWWDSVKDLEGTADMPKAGKTNPRMINSLLENNGIDVSKIDKPLIVFGESYKNKEFGHAFADESCPTIIANTGASKIFMPDGTVYDATPRVLARITGLPDSYQLPKSLDLARTIIGNGIPIKLTQGVVGPVLKENFAEVKNVKLAERDSAVNQTMTMEQAKRMLEAAFNVYNIRRDYGYKNINEWIENDGIRDVALNVESDYNIYQKYLSKLDEDYGVEYDLEDIIQAYLDGTLVGKEKPKATRLDTSKGYDVKDSRPYAPNSVTVTADTWNLANTKVTNANRAEVNKARRDILFYAHTHDIATELGITSAELFKKLRSWSAYTKQALQVSNRLNEGVAESNRWTGIENSSFLGKVNITDENIDSLVKEIIGDTDRVSRNYIGRAMLALDTHIDWSHLTFEFKRGPADPKRTSVRGLYSTHEQKITVGSSGYANTVAHEMGHALDHTWYRDITGRTNQDYLSETALKEDVIEDADARQFLKNFRIFIDSLTDTGDNRSAYTQEKTETFARFVAKFVEWADTTAGNKFYTESNTYFQDKFTASQYIEFVKLLQEKAMLDSKKMQADNVRVTTSDIAKTVSVDGPNVAEEAIAVHFSERVKPNETLVLPNGETVNKLDYLNEQYRKGEVTYTYKSFLKIVDDDGNVLLYPPMASKTKGDDGKYRMANVMAVGEWEQSIGDISKIKRDKKGNIIEKTDKDTGRKYGEFDLVKDDGGTVPAAYNPYQHSSNLMINDQFEAAHRRPGLVTYKCAIPNSELTSGYWAEYAKDPVGRHEWHAGIVAGQLSNNTRDVYLSRFLMPVEEVADKDVAKSYKELLEADGIKVPFNVVTPSLLSELEKIGVPIDYRGTPMYRAKKILDAINALMADNGVVNTELGRAEINRRINEVDKDIRSATKKNEVAKVQNLGIKRVALERLLENRTVDTAKNTELNNTIQYYLEDPIAKKKKTSKKVKGKFAERIDFDADAVKAQDVLYNRGFSATEVHDFWRAFVNKTNGLAEGTHKTISINAGNHVTIIDADGFAKGTILNASDIDDRKVGLIGQRRTHNARNINNRLAPIYGVDYGFDDFGHLWIRTAYLAGEVSEDADGTQRRTDEAEQEGQRAERTESAWGNSESGTVNEPKSKLAERESIRSDADVLNEAFEDTASTPTQRAAFNMYRNQVQKHRDAKKALDEALAVQAKEKKQGAVTAETRKLVAQARKTEGIEFKVLQGMIQNNKDLRAVLDAERRIENVALTDEMKAQRAEFNARYKELDKIIRGLESERRADIKTAYEEGVKLGIFEQKLKNEEQMAKMKEQLRNKANESKKELREQRDNKLAEQKAYYRDMISRQRTNRNEGKVRNKIKKLVNELTTMLEKPKQNHYVPAELAQPVVNLLEAINMDRWQADSKLMRLEELETQKAMFRAKVEGIEALTEAEENELEKLQKRKEFYEGRKEAFVKETEHLAALYRKVTENNSATPDPTIVEMFSNLGDVFSENIYDMHDAQLERVYNTVNAMMKVVKDSVKLKLRNEEIAVNEGAEKLISEAKQGRRSNRSKLSQIWWDSVRPQVVFERFGGYVKDSMWSKLYTLLDEGQLKTTEITMQLSSRFGKLLQNEKQLQDFTGRTWANKTDKTRLVDIGLHDAEGKTILVSKEIAAAIYMDTLNEDNAKHLAMGGKTIPDLDEYYRGTKDGGFGQKERHAVGFSAALSDAYRAKAEAEYELKNAGDKAGEDLIKKVKELTKAVEEAEAEIEDLNEQIEAYVTAVRSKCEEVFNKKENAYIWEWIKATQQMFNEDSKKFLNETTMTIYGFEKAQVDNYFPIRTDSDFRTATFESIVKDVSLENAGFMKDRIHGGNPSLALGLTAVVRTQIDMTARYCGMMPAIREFSKVYSKTESGYTSSVQKELHKEMGDYGKKYIDNLMSNLTGSRHGESNPIQALFGAMRGNLAQASLTLSPRVALSQLASLPTASAVLGRQAIAYAMNPNVKVDENEIAKYTPLYWYRMQGYSTTELGDIKNSNDPISRVWKKARVLTGWIQAMDGLATRRLWAASKYYVENTLKMTEAKDGEAYWEKVSEMYNKTIEETQPNYTAMQRPELLRNPDNLVKSLTMFSTQRLQNLSIVVDAAERYKKYSDDFNSKANGVTAADVKEAKDKLASAVSSQLVQAGTIVAIKFITDMLMSNMNKYRDDDDDEVDAESVSLALLDMYADTVIGNFFLGSTAYSFFKQIIGKGSFYDLLSINGVDTLNSLAQSVTNFTDALKADNVKPDQVMAKFGDLFVDSVVAFGIPLNNAIKLGKGAKYLLEDTINGDLFTWEASANPTKKQNTYRLLSAYIGNDEQRIAEYTELLGGESKAATELKSYIRTEYKKKHSSISREDAYGYLTKYLGMSKEDAEGTLAYWDLLKEDSNYSDIISQASYTKYNSGVKQTGVSVEDYAEVKEKADVDGNGSLTQDELGNYLRQLERAGVMNRQQVSAVWAGYQSTSKTTYLDWLSKR